MIWIVSDAESRDENFDIEIEEIEKYISENQDYYESILGQNVSNNKKHIKNFHFDSASMIRYANKLIQHTTRAENEDADFAINGLYIEL